jgi:hypothetical protein
LDLPTILVLLSVPFSSLRIQFATQPASIVKMTIVLFPPPGLRTIHLKPNDLPVEVRVEHEAGVDDADPSVIAIRTVQETAVKVATHLAEAIDDIVEFLDLARHLELGDLRARAPAATVASRTVSV